MDILRGGDSNRARKLFVRFMNSFLWRVKGEKLRALKHLEKRGQMSVTQPGVVFVLKESVVHGFLASR